MLFDLRSRRRRRFIKTVYLFLAVLIGVGLVGFGVGTGGSFGGLFNAASGGGGAPTGEDAYVKSLDKAKKRAAADPSSAANWLAVGEAAYSLAALSNNYEVNVGFTKSGYAVLAELEKAWNNYIALDPAKPSSLFANEVALDFGAPPTGTENWVTEESAQEIVAETDPTYNAYLYLSDDAYEANEPSRGQLAGERAIALAPKSQKKTVEADVAGYKATYDKAHGSGSTGASGATGSTSSTTSTTSSTTTSSSTNATGS